MNASAGSKEEPALDRHARLELDNDAAAMLIAQSDASTGAELSRIAQACEAAGGRGIAVAENETESRLLLTARRLAYPALEKLGVMRASGRGGAIVNTSSIAATGGAVGLTAYGASKGALDAMVRSVALEAGAQGVRINNVSPGVTRTPMTAQLPAEAVAQLAAHAALKRIGEPEDVARAAVWLCTDEARFITGQSLLVDGGFNIAGAH